MTATIMEGLPLAKSVILTLLIGLGLVGCVVTTPDETQFVTSVNVCVIGMCEYANNDQERTGDPSTEGDVSESLSETVETDQSASAEATVDGVPL